MEEVGVRELRDHLSAWLDSVKSGQEVVITERGKPVARIIPIGWTDRLARLVAEGSVTLPRRPRTSPDTWRLVKPTGGNVSDYVIEDRR